MGALVMETVDEIYLDNAATSWPKPEAVYQAIDHYNRRVGASPGRGSHSRTIAAGQLVLNTREKLAELFNIKDSSRIIFTENVTMAINIGLKGLLEPGDHVVISSMEHNAVARPIHALKDSGVIDLTIIQCAADGSLDPCLVEQAITEKTRLVCLLHASNLTGTIMPIDDVGEIAYDNGVLFMVDAAQTAGVLPLDVEEQRIDMLAFTGHKGLLGPQGTGGLYIRPDLKIRPFIEGGTGSLSEQIYQPDFMPDKLESGTPNTPGIAGLGAGVEFIQQTGIESICRHEQELTDMLIEGLRDIDGVILYGPQDSKRQTAVVSFNIEEMDCGGVSMLLDQKYGILCRSGLHCAPLAHRTLGTLKSGACRISAGIYNTKEEIDKLVRAVYEIARSNEAVNL
jgi:cysteine desulfurase family protein